MDTRVTEGSMRKTNWRLVIVGLAMILLGLGFYIGMGTMERKSNDPVALMQTVGTASGAVGGLGAVMAIFGLIGQHRRDGA
jgi:flagellar motor component MotA